MVTKSDRLKAAPSFAAASSFAAAAQGCIVVAEPRRRPLVAPAARPRSPRKLGRAGTLNGSVQMFIEHSNVYRAVECLSSIQMFIILELFYLLNTKLFYFLEYFLIFNYYLRFFRYNRYIKEIPQ